MNKSKILKRSLAVILAMMMIFAMIPLSASAADAPVVHSINVGNASATGSGTAWEAKVPTSQAGAIVMGVVLEGNKGMVYYKGKTVGDAGSAVTYANGVYSIAVGNYADLTDGKATFQMYDEDGGNATDVTVTFTLVTADNDATVKSFTIAGQYGDTVIDNAANTITVVVPYGYTPVVPTFAANSAVATAEFSGEEGKAVLGDTNRLYVTAQSGGSKTYAVIVKAAAGFTAFSVEGERKDAKIDATNKKVTVYMPYGSNATSGNTPAFKFTPSFTTGYPSVTVYGVKAGGSSATSSDLVALTSGEEVDLATFANLTAGESVHGAAMTAVLKYTGGVTEDWTIEFNAPTLDPVPEIKEFKVANFAAEISGKTITLELPAALRGAEGTASVVMSKLVKVEVNGANIVAQNEENDDGDTLVGIDLTKDTQSLLVTAAGPNDDDVIEKATYTLKISTKEAEQAQIKAAALQDGDGNTYTATIDQTAGIIAFSGIPFADDDYDALVAGGYRLFYTITNGSVVEFEHATGEALTAKPEDPAQGKSYDEDKFPTAFDGKTKGGRIYVATPSSTGAGVPDSEKAYNITVSRADAARGSKLTSFTLTNVSAAKDITAANSYTTEPTTANALTISIADSKYADYVKAVGVDAYAQAELSDEAALYYVDGDGELVPIKLITAAAAGEALPTIAGYNGVDDPKTLTLVVLSQQAQAILVDPVGTEWNAAAKAGIQANGGNAGDFTEYALSVLKKDPQNGAAIETFTVYNPQFDETVTATINQGTRVISFTVPYRWTTVGNDWVADFTTYHDSLVYVSNEAGTAPTEDQFVAMQFDADGAWVKNTGTLFWYYEDEGLFYEDDEERTQKLPGLWAVSETGADMVNYGFVVKVEDPNTEAQLISATINGSTGKPDANQKVSISLPFGTEITALKIKLVASKNAYIFNYDAQGRYFDDDEFLYSEDTPYNFTQPQRFVVIAEDGRTMITYTVSVTLGNQFDDVDPNKWYAAEIMEAVQRGIAYGYNGKFNPDKPVTRGQFAQFLARADGYDAADYENVTRFSDVPAGTEQAAAIAYCYDKGYVAGYNDGTFAADKYINRQEVATILAQFKGLSKVTGTPEKPFADDAKIAAWAKGWVYAVADAKVMVGKGENFDPLGNTTRAEACAVCVRVTK